MARCKGVIENLSPQLEGAVYADLEQMQREKDELLQRIREREEEYSQLKFRRRSNEEAYHKLTSLWHGCEKLHMEYQERQKLYDTAGGKRNGKISFERYVLAAYFSDVIAMANLRLEQMTNSRYTLNRRKEKEKGNRLSGLSLEVFDANTGKSRHVNTLSGGESFKISLCLALGLADTISQNSGGIELNTMFIDEGFGSLDQASLENAVECLNDLKLSGRYIGIISHVSELKEKIPAKLLIKTGPQGSGIEIQA